MTPPPTAPADPTAAANGRAGLGITVLLATMSMLGPFSIDTMFPAFESMGRVLPAEPVELQQLVSVYLIAFAAMSVLHGPISDAVGRRPVVIIGTAAYALASAGCALSPSLTWLLVLRAAQGLCAGSSMIVGRAVVRDLFEGAAAQRLMSQVMLIFGIAPAIAPIAGGWLLLLGPWPVVFWFLAAYGAVLSALTAAFLPETHPPDRRSPLRVRSVVGGICQVGKSLPFQRLSAAAAANFAALFLYISSAPVFVTGILGLGERDFWVLFVPVVGCMSVGSWVAGRLADRMDATRMASIGLIVCLVGGIVNVTQATLTGGARLPWAVTGPSIGAFGVSLAFPVISIALLDMFPVARGAAASMQSVTALLLNALIAGVVSPIVTRDPHRLAWCALGFTLLAVALWVGHRRAQRAHGIRRLGRITDPEQHEPTDEL